MSRRFGRQQKRRLRAELAEKENNIARLTEAVSMSNGLASSLRSKMEEHREYLAYIVNTIDRVAPNSALLPPKTVMYDVDVRAGVLHGTIRLARSLPMFNGIDGPSGDALDGACQTITLHQLETTIERDRFDLSVHAHVRLVDTNNHSAYAVSASAAQRMNPSERKRLVQEIAERLLGELELGMRR